MRPVAKQFKKFARLLRVYIPLYVDHDRGEFVLVPPRVVYVQLLVR